MFLLLFIGVWKSSTLEPITKHSSSFIDSFILISLSLISIIFYFLFVSSFVTTSISSLTLSFSIPSDIVIISSEQLVCTSQGRRRRLVCLVLGSAGAGRGQAMGRTGICSACYAIDQDRRRRGWRRQHLAQPRSRTGRALRTAVRWPGYRPRHPSHRGPRARSAHATTTRTGIRGEQLGGQTDPGSGDSP